MALLLTVLVGVSFDLRTVLHAHADGEQDLRARQLARVDSLLPCDAAPHWDRAHAETQPACAACLAAATALDRAAATVTWAPAPLGSPAARPAAPDLLGASPTAPHSGRAPPALLEQA